MNIFFDFGEYWDTGTFMLFLLIGITISKLCHLGSVRNFKRSKKLNQNLESNTINVFYIAAFIIIWFFYAFKNESVGIDTDVYLSYFHNIEDFTIETERILTLHQMEPFYILLTKVIRTFTDSSFIYFSIIGAIISFSYIKFFKTFWTYEANHLFIIPFVISYQNSMSGVRNALGISFILLSICELNKNNYGKAIILTIIGTLFHYSIAYNVFVIAFHYIMENLENDKNYRKVILTGVISLITIILLSNINALVSSTKYLYYAERGGGTLFGNWYVISAIIISVYSLVKFKYIESPFKTNTYITLSNIITLIIALGTGGYRLPYYYAFSRMNTWSFLTAKIENQYRKEVVMIIQYFLLLLIIFYLLFRMSRNSHAPGFAYELIKF